MPQSIEGGVVIINTLSTKNNGDYPLVMAESVEMKNGKNVEDEINEITENISGIINDTDINQNSTWSSKNIIEKLSIPFEDSNSIVFCQPIEGTPLNIMVDIESIQEGTGDPSPENVRPIKGFDTVNVWRNGKNLWGGKFFEAEYTSGIPYITEYEDITFPYNPAYATEGLAVILPVSAYQTFTFKAHEANENATYRYAIYVDFESAYNYENKLEYKTVLSNTSFTVSSSGIMVFMIGGAWTSDNDKIHVFTEEEKFQLELGDTSTPYEPYRGETFTISLGQTVYGGTLDINTGTLTIIYSGRTLTSSLEWSLYNNEYEGASFMCTDFGDSKIEFQTSICSHFKNVDHAWNSKYINTYGIFSDHPSSQTKYFRPPNENITTVELFKEWLDEQKEAGTPVQFAYKLADPVTIQLAPQEILALSGVNTIYSDAGNITVSGYPAFRTLPVPISEDEGKVLTVVGNEWVAMTPGYESKNWDYIQKIVRMGKAPQYFPIGYEFTTHDSTENTDIIWRVVGHDTIKASDEALTHSMVLETKYVYSNSAGNYISLQFDAPETLYYAETGLEAGTYNFTLLAGYDETYGGGKTYSFTLTQPVPAGGIIVFPWEYNQQASETKISTYATQTDTSAIETIGVTEGANGTSLGTADGNTLNMNHTHRVRYGSNNYAQSAVKQWLNSNEGAGSVWKLQTKFDRPPSWASSRTGFMAGLPEDFLAAVQPAIVPCRTNSVSEINSLDGTVFTTNQTYSLEDRFFLLSRPEIYGTWDSAEVKDGELLEYYSGLTDAERIKYDPSGSARACWLRSPVPGYADRVCHVVTSGALSGNGAYYALAAAPACIIA